MELLLKTSMEGVVVRSWQADDALQLSSIANDMDIWRNLPDSFPHPYSLKDAESWMERSMKERPQYNLAIIVNGKVAGSIGMRPGKDVMRFVGEVTFWLGKKYWSKGYASAALEAYIKYAFHQLGFRYLMAFHFTWGDDAGRVLKKNGFQRLGTLPNAGNKDREFVDVMLYGLAPKG
ncbi:MAG: GNAT family N-acetyltransferase [Bacteroidetes bacterium]|nr:GNAT family N-acetyltransferase [Bacteroidota bacterium]